MEDRRRQRHRGSRAERIGKAADWAVPYPVVMGGRIRRDKKDLEGERDVGHLVTGPAASPTLVSRAVRRHWRVESFRRDPIATFHEDARDIRRRNVPVAKLRVGGGVAHEFLAHLRSRREARFDRRLYSLPRDP